MGEHDAPLGLNVGCGDFPAAGWINFDLAVRGREAVASAVALPVLDASVDYVYMGHVLEHLAWDDVPPALNEAARVLRPGGQLCVVGPDVERAVRRRMPWDELLPLLEDDEARGGNANRHQWNCSERRLLGAVQRIEVLDAEAIDIVDVPESWPVTSRIWWQCAVLAKRR